MIPWIWICSNEGTFKNLIRVLYYGLDYFEVISVKTLDKGTKE